MAAPKGHNFNPKGRGKGNQNKKTKEVKEKIEWALGLLEETIEADIKSLPPSQRAALWKDLQEFVRPKLARTETKVEGQVDSVLTIKREIVTKNM